MSVTLERKHPNKWYVSLAMAIINLALQDAQNGTALDGVLDDNGEFCAACYLQGIFGTPEDLWGPLLSDIINITAIKKWANQNAIHACKKK
jgi:hypothetical protein